MDEKNDNKMSFRITARTVAACPNLVENALSNLEGVSFASVNLTTGSAFIIADGSVTFETLRDAAAKTGYDILKCDPSDTDDENYRKELGNLYFVLLLGVLLLAAMCVQIAAGRYFHIYGIIEAAASGSAIFWGGRKILHSAWIAIIHFHTNGDTLIAMSTAAAWLTSIMSASGTAIPSFAVIGVFILALHLLGRCAEPYIRCKAAIRLKSLMPVRPSEARVIIDEISVMVPIAAVKPETVIEVNAGERIPMDGIVIEGLSGVDESMITGESLPVAKDTGSAVTGGSFNISGSLKIKTARAGEDKFIPKIQELVQKAHCGEVPLQSFAGRITVKLVPAVVMLATLSAAAWFLFFNKLILLTAPVSAYIPLATAFTSPAYTAAYAFLATLVTAYPCALSLAAPVALAAGAAEASRKGLVVRNAETMQTLHNINYAVIDKTGTLTNGRPKVVEWELPEYAHPYVAALEKNSEHPLASALKEIIGGKTEKQPDSISEIPGEGISGKWGKTEWFVGRPAVRHKWTEKSALARTIVEVRNNGEPIGFFGIEDTIREDSRSAVSDLRKMGIATVIATGDGKEAAMEIAGKADIDSICWEVRPSDKLSMLHEAKENGMNVLMAGDGINDAAALECAHVGIAMGSGTDLAVDSSDIVIASGGISKIVSAMKISNRTCAVIRQNIILASLYNITAMPLAVSGLLHPAAAGLVLAASCLALALNSLRIFGSADK